MTGDLSDTLMGLGIAVVYLFLACVAFQLLRDRWSDDREWPGSIFWPITIVILLGAYAGRQVRAAIEKVAKR